MLAIVLALASAIGYGNSDFAAGLASRRAGIIQVTLLASLASTMASMPPGPRPPSPAHGSRAAATGTKAGVTV
jgi:hypothetical protein